MKHFLLSTTFLFATFFATHAQITVDQADYPSVNDVVYIANDSVPNVVVGNASSIAQSWDFTSLYISTVDTHNFVDPINTQFGSSYSTSNLADTTITQETTTYLNKTAIILEILGVSADPFNAGQNSNIKYANPQTTIELPATYGSNFTDQVFFQFAIDASQFNIPTVDSIRLNHHSSVTSVIDAHGDLTIPGGGPFTTIRQLTVEDIIDSVFIFSNFTGKWTLAPTFQGFLDENPVRDTTYRYTWIAKNEDFPVCEITTDTVEGNALAGSFKLGYDVVGWLTNVNEPTCAGDGDGEATVTGLSGTPPYGYLWDANANNQTTATATGLSNGNYDVTITDALLDTYILTVTVNDPNPSPLSATTTETGPSCGTCTDGTATANPIGGTSPFTYEWDANAANQTDQTATGLATGNYDVTITDACGETFVVTGTVPVGVKDFEALNSIKVFPNPTKGTLYIHAEGISGNMKLEINNVIGQQVMSKTINTNSILDIGYLKDGIYLIHLTTEKGAISKKISLVR